MKYMHEVLYQKVIFIGDCGSNEDTPSNERNAYAHKKWKIKSNKAFYVVKITIENDWFYHIDDIEMPHNAWKIFSKFFLKKNIARL